MHQTERDFLINLDLDRQYKIITNIYTMLNDRGYDPEIQLKSKRKWIGCYLGYISEMEDDAYDLDAYGVIDNMSLLFKKEKKTLLVYFYPLISKLCQSDMNYIHSLMTKKEAHHLIIVANKSATSKVSNVIGILGPDVQLFSEDELMLNVTKHQLVPKHILLTGKEKKQVIKAYVKDIDGTVHLDRLPGLFTNDPIAKYYNYKANNIIKIERPRPDGYVDISYRVVIHPITDRDKK